MSKFKIGDKVVMVRPDIAEMHYAPANEFPSVGTVKAIQKPFEGGNSDWESVTIKEGLGFYWAVDALELADSK